MALARLRLAPSIATLLLYLGVSGCNIHPVLTDEDARKIVEAVAENSYAKFGRKVCIVAHFSNVFPGIPPMSAPEGEALDDGKTRFWVLPSPAVAFPASIMQKYRTTPSDFGCSETIRLSRPTLYEFEENGRRWVIVFEDVDNLCGPVCGQRFSASFEKHGEEYTLSADGIQSTGLSF